jgi:hypothetical protein
MLGPRPVDIGALKREIIRLAGMFAAQERYIAQMTAYRVELEESCTRLQLRVEARDRKINIMNARLMMMFGEDPVAP